MSDEKQTGMPLHFRILIALVVGTVVGVAINPGAIELPDCQSSVWQCRLSSSFNIEATSGV